MDNWSWLTFYTYVKVNNRKSEAVIEKFLPTLIREKGGDRLADAIKVHLQPADSIYFKQRFSEDGRIQKSKVVAQKIWTQKYLFWFAVIIVMSFILNFKLSKFLFLPCIISLALGVQILIQFAALSTDYTNRLSTLGFDPEVRVLEFDHPMLHENYALFKEAILKRKEITHVGGANHIMEGIFGTYRIFREDEIGDPDAGQRLNFYPVQYDFFDALSISFRSGSGFSEIDFSNDTLRKLIFNESAALALSSDGEIIGERFYIAGQGGIHGEVIGVVEDFYYDHPDKSIPPLVCFFRNNAFNYVAIKENDVEAIDVIDEEWQNFYPGITLDAMKLKERDDFILDEHKVVYEHSLYYLLPFSLVVLTQLLLTTIGLLNKKT